MSSFVADTLTNPSVGPWVCTFVYYLLFSNLLFMAKREMSLGIKSVMTCINTLPCSWTKLQFRDLLLAARAMGVVDELFKVEEVDGGGMGEQKMCKNPNTIMLIAIHA